MALLAFVLALLVPILGPVAALILLAGRDRRAPGESSVYAFAIYMGMTELLLTVLAFVFIPLLN